MNNKSKKLARRSTTEKGRRAALRKAAGVLSLLLLANASPAQQPAQLGVSASIPPHACEYPQRCQPVQAQTVSRVSIANGTIRYVGSRPAVTRTEAVVMVLF